MIWVIIIVVAIILAFIGYVADKNGYFAKKEENLETVDFSELSRPKEEVVQKPKEEDISGNFDELPDVADTYDELPKVEVEEEVSEDLYAPFGDQEVEIANSSDNFGVEEVEENNYNQSFVDIEKIESEAIDINNEEDKKAVDDLMKGQFELEFEMPEDEKPKEEIKKQEEEKKKKEDDGITDMWKF